MRWIVTVTLASFLFSEARAAAEPPSEAARKAQQQVDQELARLKGVGARTEPIVDEAVEKLFPSYHFVAVVFPRFPIARAVPEGLKPSDVFAVSTESKVELMTDAKELQAFFARTIAPVKSEKAARDVLTAWLRLTQEFSQDGFYHFSIARDSIMLREQDGWVAAGTVQVVPERGNKGEIRATLTFDASGKLTRIDEAREVQPGIRPRVIDP